MTESDQHIPHIVPRLFCKTALKTIDRVRIFSPYYYFPGVSSAFGHNRLNGAHNSPRNVAWGAKRMKTPTPDNCGQPTSQTANSIFLCRIQTNVNLRIVDFQTIHESKRNVTSLPLKKPFPHGCHPSPGHQPSKDQSQLPPPPTDVPLLAVVYGDGGSEVPWPLGPNLWFVVFTIRSLKSNTKSIPARSSG